MYILDLHKNIFFDYINFTTLSTTFRFITILIMLQKHHMDQKNIGNDTFLTNILPEVVVSRLEPL
jgi:hypothetical protein